MRCNARNRFAVRLLKLSLHATHIVFQVHCHLRHSGLVQKEESAATIHQRFHFRGRSGFYYTPQRCTNGICHGNIADTAFCFRRCDKVGLFSRPTKLPPHMDTVPLKVDICSCQAIQLTHTQAGSHKNDDIIIIVSAIVLNELQIFLLLFSGQGIAHISVLRHNVRQLELKWILADDVILYRHLKRRSDNALQDSYGVLLETAVHQKENPSCWASASVISEKFSAPVSGLVTYISEHKKTHCKIFQSCSVFIDTKYLTRHGLQH